MEIIIANLRSIHKFPIIILCCIAFFGMIILYSVNSGDFFPWSFNQFLRFIVGGCFLAFGACVPTKVWSTNAYILLLVGIIFLVFVVLLGRVCMGAQRWLNFHFFSFQPSEMTKIFLVFALSKYFATIESSKIKKLKALVLPICMILIPTILVLTQPDLGTAMIFVIVGLSMFFVAGVQLWKFAAGAIAAALSWPIFWQLLHDYQKARIIMFLNPELDPNGAGYHTIQAKIALGSGAIFGKGLLNGTQCQLNFLPEKQTDFVFAALGEELGFIGCISLVILYAILIYYNFRIIFNIKDKFARLMVFGLNSMIFFYVFINISMVCGLLPVVGVPLPFFSYGGSSLVVLMFCQGVILCAQQKQSSKTLHIKQSY